MEQEEERATLNKENWKNLNFRYGIAVRKNKNYRKAIKQLQTTYMATRYMNSLQYDEILDLRRRLFDAQERVSQMKEEKENKWWHLW